MNNVLGFPYIFRGALDVRATTINDAMKLAAAEALAALAREDVPDEVVAAYQGNRPRFGPRYIIPVPFDPRLISAIPPAVAKAAMETGVARRPIEDMEAYRHQLSARRDPIAGTLQQITARVRQNPQRIVFAEGEEEAVIRAAVSFANQRFGTPILVGREDLVKQRAAEAGIELKDGIEIMNARLSTRRDVYADYLYKRLQRNGYLHRDCARLINTDRNHFAACMVALGDADGLVTGITRSYSTVLQDLRRCIDTEARPSRDRRLDRALPRPHGGRRRHGGARHAELGGARRHRRGGGRRGAAARLRSARGDARLLDLRQSFRRARREGEGGGAHPRQPQVDFEYDGEMGADVALNPTVMASYPFCRLSGPANVLVMPARHSAAISTNMLQELGGSTVLGPLLVGFDQPGADPADLRARFRHRQHGGARGVQYQRVRAGAYLTPPVVIPDGAPRAGPGPILTARQSERPRG